MSRDVPFDENAICDECGKIGCYDFMGDFYCPECVLKFMKPDYYDYYDCEEIEDDV